MHTSTVVSNLRQARNSGDLLQEIRKDSFEDRVARTRDLVEAVDGRVLLASFPRHAIYVEGGAIFRADLVENQKTGTIVLQNIEEMADMAIPTGTIDELRREALETAAAVVEDVLGSGDPASKVLSLLEAFQATNGGLYAGIALENLRKHLSEQSWWRNYLKTSETTVREYTRGHMDDILSEAPKSRYDFDATHDQLQDKAAQLRADLKFIAETFGSLRTRLTDAEQGVTEEFAFDDTTPLAMNNFQRFVETLKEDLRLSDEMVGMALSSEDLSEQAQTYESLVAAYSEVAQAVLFVEGVIKGNAASE